MMNQSRKKYLIPFLLILITSTLSASSLDSLESVLRLKITSNNVNDQLDAYFELGQAYYDHKELDKALEYLLTAESLAVKLKKDKLKLEIQYKLGRCYSSRHQYDESIVVFTKLVKELNGREDKEHASACYWLAKAYQVRGNSELAFEYHFKTLQIREKLKDVKGVAFSNYQIGNIHFNQGNYHKSIEYYEKCLDITEKLELIPLQLAAYGAIGGAYSRLGQIDLSLDFNLRAYNLSIATKGKPSFSYITFNLGDNYQVLEEYDKALDFFMQSHELNIESNDLWGQIQSTKAIGEIYITKGNTKRGMKYLRESLDIAQGLGARPIMIDVYSSLARNLEEVGEHQEANKYYREFIALKDSLVNEATLEKMSDTKMKYEMSQKERDIQRRDAQLQNTYRNFLIVGLLALMVILWQLHTKYKTQTEHNRVEREKNYKIQQQNEELEKVHLKQVETNQLLTDQNEQILNQNKSLEVKNEELQRFAYIASHDLKEPLRNIGSFATLLKRRFKGQLGKDADEYIDFITTNVSRMYDLLHEVLMFSKLENEEIIDEWTPLNEVIQTVQETLRGKIMEQNVDFNIADLPAVKGHRSHLMQLFQNLISNSIKYNKSDQPLIQIGMKTNYEGNDRVYFVKDNGIGIDMEFKERVFEIFKRLHGKDEFEGTGVGLAICKKIVTQANGDIWVDSNVGEGSTFYFTLNVDTKFSDITMVKNKEAIAQGITLN